MIKFHYDSNHRYIAFAKKNTHFGRYPITTSFILRMLCTNDFYKTDEGLIKITSKSIFLNVLYHCPIRIKYHLMDPPYSLILIKPGSKPPVLLIS